MPFNGNLYDANSNGHLGNDDINLFNSLLLSELFGGSFNGDAYAAHESLSNVIFVGCEFRIDNASYLSFVQLQRAPHGSGLWQSCRLLHRELRVAGADCPRAFLGCGAWLAWRSGGL